ncbi:ATP-binding cassette domain-containing protein [Streptomyces sp. 3214.6]|uniref:ATP-binding cassette domain-containing protein n=1 Tax=Streptomyces sp. 3214.6 TaxID=1882757 RepID=UPI000909D98C|nr:ATP-binding cassette domain-containing protein [Streptomyces sp. 3214.6]SHI24128.1 ABC-2 type transport system ATP-binding protein [Streptomyces sp. 3214.6]
MSLGNDPAAADLQSAAAGPIPPAQADRDRSAETRTTRPAETIAAVEQATVRYGSLTALDGVSLGFPVGVTGLLGPNGAGKSTLLSLLSTAQHPNEGIVTLLGEPVGAGGRRTVRRVRERIGVLPQSFGYYPRFTALEFVEYAAWLRKVPSRGRRDQARAALRQVAMEKHADRRMGDLSGGMLRRVGIAQAVVNRPALVLLDEPTVGLDPAQRVGFRDLIKGLGEHSAVVMSTHLAEDVVHTCDRVSVLLEGRVRFDGTLAELCALPGENGTVESGYLHLVGPEEAVL